MKEHCSNANARALRHLPIALASAALAACGGGRDDERSSADPTNVATAGVAATLTVTDPASPIVRTSVALPASAVSAGQVQVSIGFEDAPPGPLRAQASAQGAQIVSKTIVLRKDRPGSFNTAVTVTVPYDVGKLAAGDVPSVLFWDEFAKDYQAMAVVDHDAARGLVSFRTAHFSRYVVAAIKGLGAQMAGAATPAPGALDTDTGYRPSADGFFHSNIGSYSSPNGNCLGMASYADWFHERAKVSLAAGKGLVTQYLEGNVASQDDDIVAEELIVRAHAAASQEWALRQSLQLSRLGQAATATALLQAMKLTGKPQLFLMFGNPTWSSTHEPATESWGHALVVYRYRETDGTFYFYDPNLRGDDTAGVFYTAGVGFTGLTKRGMYSPEPTEFAFDAKGSVYSPDDMRALYDGAAKGWSEGQYGRFTFSSITVDAATRVALITERKNVRLKGTVVSTGGAAASAPNTVDLFVAGALQGSHALTGGMFDIALPDLPESSTVEVLLVARCEACAVGNRTASLYSTFSRIKLKAQSALDNLGFESGNTVHWSSQRRLWDASDVVTPSDKSEIVSLGFDAIADTIATVLHGRHALRVNNSDSGEHISTISRDIVVSATASTFALNFNWAAVLEDPQHDPSEQPYVVAHAEPFKPA